MTRSRQGHGSYQEMVRHPGSGKLSSPQAWEDKGRGGSTAVPETAVALERGCPAQACGGGWERERTSLSCSLPSSAAASSLPAPEARGQGRGLWFWRTASPGMVGAPAMGGHRTTSTVSGLGLHPSPTAFLP